jgi:hypothetical protein
MGSRAGRRREDHGDTTGDSHLAAYSARHWRAPVVFLPRDDAHPTPLASDVIEEVDGRRRFVQGRAADLSGRTPTLLPPPVSDLLVDPRGVNGRPVHQLEPAAIPACGYGYGYGYHHPYYGYGYRRHYGWRY